MRFARQVHGNQSIEKTTENALRITQFYKVPVPVYMGAAKPMLRPAKHCAEIHGSTGLDSIDGSHGLPPCSDEFMADWETRHRSLKAVPEMFRAIRAEFEERKSKVTIVATGSLTNVALCIAVYGDDLREAVEGIVFMGGSVREGGNTGIQTEFNMQTDPEAAQLVIDSGIPATMVPLDVTHTVICDDDVISKIRTASGDDVNDVVNRTIDLLRFFQSTYDSVFGFAAPPLHDPVAVAYVSNPELFRTEALFVSIETHNPLSAGQTLVDVHRVTDNRPNVVVARSVDVDAFWDLLLGALKRVCDRDPLS